MLANRQAEHNRQRPYSIRTRIKTAYSQLRNEEETAQRPSANRTRIKTDEALRILGVSSLSEAICQKNKD